MQVPDNELANKYRANGFVTVASLLDHAELQALRQRMDEIAEGRVAFPSELIEYEPVASGSKGTPAVRKINRCAECDPIFMTHACHPKILAVVESLIGPDIKLFGSQCFMKPPGGIEKPYHQDSAYFAIEPRALVTCWTALDDATVENGCLWVIPGTHRGPLLDHDEPWLVGEREDMQVRQSQVDKSQEVPNELLSGSCSFHHSMLLHRSGPNQTNHSRRGLAVHYMSSRSRWTRPGTPQPEYPLLRGQAYQDCV